MRKIHLINLQHFAEDNNMTSWPFIQVIEAILDIIDMDIQALNETYISLAGGYSVNLIPPADMSSVEHFLETYRPIK